MNLMELYRSVFAALAQGGLPAIVDAAHRVMGLPLSLHDSAFNLLAAAPREKLGDPFWDACLDTGVYPREIIMTFHEQGFMLAATERQSPYYVDWGDCAELPRIQGVVRIHEVVEGYVTLYCPKALYNEDYGEATQLIVDACALEMERGKSHNLSPDPLLKVLIHDLLRGPLNGEALALWQTRLPPSFLGPFQLLAVDIAKQHRSGAQKFMVESLDRHGLRHIEIAENETLYLLLYALGQPLPQALEEEWRRILGHYKGRAGLSAPFDDLLRFAAARQQAEKALEWSAFTEGEARIALFQQDHFPIVISAIANAMDAESYMAPGIALLQDYDRSYGTQYLPTLRQYVLSSRNGKIVQDKLKIHRNTLLYRLKKTEELLSISLEDPSTLAHLYISFYLQEMLGASS